MTPPEEKSAALISVICRSINRPELQVALDSIAAQSYPNVEVILVDVHGEGAIDLTRWNDSLDIKVVAAAASINRPESANLGIDAALGSYLCFLDDDDWIGEDHLQALYDALQEESDFLAAYSVTQRATFEGELLEEFFDHPFDRYALYRDNYIPIHSILFSSALIDKGCCFDPELEIYEDWDFWIQASQYSDFLHTTHVSAFYRYGGDSATEVAQWEHKYQVDHPNALARERVLTKWQPTRSGADINRMLGSLDKYPEIEALHCDLRESAKALDEANKRAEKSQLRLTEQNATVNQLRGELKDSQLAVSSLRNEIAIRDEVIAARDRDMAENIASYGKLLQQHEELNAGIKEILSTRSWRLSRPLRYFDKKKELTDSAPTPSSPALPDPTQTEIEDATEQQPTASVESDASHFHFWIESPANAKQPVSEYLHLKGWAFSERGPVKVRVSYASQVVTEFDTGLERIDVAAEHSSKEFAGMSGFSCHLPLQQFPEGDIELQISFLLEGKSVNSIPIKFPVLNRDTAYQRWAGNNSQHSVDPFAVDKTLADSEANVAVLLLCQGHEAEEILSSIQGVQRQTFANWHCFILDAKTADEEIPKQCSYHFGMASVFSEQLQSFSHVTMLRAGEIAGAELLAALVRSVEREETDISYSDHDRVDESGGLCDPEFTPSWSPDLFLARNYVADVFLIKAASLLSVVGGTDLESYNDPAWRYRLLLEAWQAGYTLSQVDTVGWSATRATTEQQREQELKQIEAFFLKHGLNARVQANSAGRSIDWTLTNPAKVSLIIPTAGQSGLVEKCIESLRRNTDYPNYEIIVLDNSRGKNHQNMENIRRQDLKVLTCDTDFNWSALNNIGAAAAEGEYLLFLNDDIEAVQPNWLHELVKLAQRNDVGSVGALLNFPNGAIQHAGVVLGDNECGGFHLFHKLFSSPYCYQHLDCVTREVSANTGACMLLRTKYFRQLGGFDENLPIVGNDLDLCLRLSEAGLRNLWTPACQLIHHESLTRGQTAHPADEAYLRAKWQHRLSQGDPYLQNHYSRDMPFFSLPLAD